jgi:hypothetical protein
MGNVLIVAGTIGKSTEATGDFIAMLELPPVLPGDLIKRNHGHLSYFEIVSKLGSLQGVAKSPEVAAVRALPVLRRGL